MEEKVSTNRRLDEINSEIEKLSLDRDNLKIRWENEKNLIFSLRQRKASIEQLRTQVENFERAVYKI